DTSRITRYRSQSLRLLDSALEQMRAGRWERAEDLMWGSLSLAVKGVALSRGQDLEGDEAVQAYATQVGQERRDRRIREAFPQLSKFGETVTRVRDSRARVDHLFRILEDVMAAVEHLWDMVLQDDR
ncbi:MAG: hypothetical protein J4N84_00505, partial [Chloroflexi bacterium]|nr:hypothetical protein [Chloroflexota bacterium]